MPNRNVYDLSTYFAACGTMQNLMTIMEPIPVISGDSLSISMMGAFKFSELKRYITLDARIDIHAFFVSHRTVYGDAWETMIKEGIVDTTTAGTPLTTINTGSTGGLYPICFMGNTPATGSTPAAYMAGYNKIWNEFFRVPNVEDEISETNVPTDGAGGEEHIRRWGRPTARLPQFWNTGANEARMNATDYAEVSASGGAGAVNLLDIAAVQSTYRDQVDKEWFSHRYRDVIEWGWGSNGVQIDSDERPELLWSVENWTSGYNIDGTSGDSFGALQGRVNSLISFRMPMRYFKEHGMVWIMAVVRFPALLMQETHYLKSHAWDYATISGDPNLAAITPPEDLTLADFTENGTGTRDMGKHPAYQYWRTAPSCTVHRNFWSREGFPFISAGELGTDVGAGSDVTYGGFADGFTSGTEERSFFQEVELGHWNIVGKAEVEARRVIPEATKSLYAGAHLR